LPKAVQTPAAIIIQQQKKTNIINEKSGGSNIINQPLRIKPQLAIPKDSSIILGETRAKTPIIKSKVQVNKFG
jgi:hypothetical protein